MSKTTPTARRIVACVAAFTLGASLALPLPLAAYGSSQDDSTHEGHAHAVADGGNDATLAHASGDAPSASENASGTLPDADASANDAQAGQTAQVDGEQPADSAENGQSDQDAAEIGMADSSASAPDASIENGASPDAADAGGIHSGDAVETDDAPVLPLPDAANGVETALGQSAAPAPEGENGLGTLETSAEAAAHRSVPSLDDCVCNPLLPQCEGLKVNWYCLACALDLDRSVCKGGTSQECTCDHMVKCDGKILNTNCPACRANPDNCKGNGTPTCTCLERCLVDELGMCKYTYCQLCTAHPERCEGTEEPTCDCAFLCTPGDPWSGDCALCRIDPSQCVGENWCICRYACTSQSRYSLCAVCKKDASQCTADSAQPAGWSERQDFGDAETAGSSYNYKYVLDENKIAWEAQKAHYEKVTDCFYAFLRFDDGDPYFEILMAKFTYSPAYGWQWDFLSPSFQHMTAEEIFEQFGTVPPVPNPVTYWKLPEVYHNNTYNPDPVFGPFIDGNFPWETGNVPVDPDPQDPAPAPSPKSAENPKPAPSQPAAPEDDAEEEEEVDKSALQGLLADVAADMTSPDFGTLDEYTPETRNPFVAAVKNAHAVNRDPAATQGQVDAAYDALYVAWTNLEREDADKDKLQALVTIANGKLFTNGTDVDWKYYDGVWFTEESSAALAACVSAAQAVLSDDDAKEDEIQTAYDNLLYQLCYGMEKNPNYGNELEKVPDFDEMLPTLMETNGSLLGALGQGLNSVCEKIRDATSFYDSVTTLSDAVKSAIKVAKKAAESEDDPYGRENASNALSILEEVYGWIKGLNEQQREQFLFKNSQTRRHGAWSQTAALLERAGIEPGLENADTINRLVYDVNYAAY